jgi:hypothetical protein
MPCLNEYKFTNNCLVQHPDKRFGFPHLSYPSNPYLITPYDGVYAVGTNNVDVNNNPKPDNQWHVEDVQGPVADYLSQTEVAPEDLFLSNQTIGSSAAMFSGYAGGYIAEFEARNSIICGNTSNGTISLYEIKNFQRYLTPPGNLQVAINTKAIIHAGVEVALYPGTEIPQGAEAALYIDFFSPGTCNTNVLQRAASAQQAFETVPMTHEELPETITIPIEHKGIEVYPNPVASQLNVLRHSEDPSSMVQIYDLSGKLILEETIENNSRQTIDFNRLENGIYLMKISGSNFKLIVNK